MVRLPISLITQDNIFLTGILGESVNDFYVSNRPTGGGREYWPFELTWMVDTIGWPKETRAF